MKHVLLAAAFVAAVLLGPMSWALSGWNGPIPAASVDLYGNVVGYELDDHRLADAQGQDVPVGPPPP
ncbi:hypothetical protein [Geminicoccus flavidas]|uniref:hypothetical protein n=1 Tax=Geminicoccus flavidas TaxID=2506407 RepID=UPI00135BD394|nr:hypothetical protein [Geminicoccus flavidas]